MSEDGGVRLGLLPIGREGLREGIPLELPPPAEEVVAATVELYEKAGYQEPWVGYLALVDKTVVGSCGFKSPPVDDTVEIAYFTFPGHEGRGFATAMAAFLVTLAGRVAPRVAVVAQTLPEESASTAVLRKLGFDRTGEVDHPEDGRVWEWRLARGSAR